MIYKKKLIELLCVSFFVLKVYSFLLVMYIKIVYGCVIWACHSVRYEDLSENCDVRPLFRLVGLGV